MDQGLSLRQAAAQLGISVTTAHRMLRRAAAADTPQPRRARPAPHWRIDGVPVPDWFVRAAKYYYLLTNSSRTGGSVPEAIRRTMCLPTVPVGWTHRHVQRLLDYLGMEQLPECPQALRDALAQRFAAGKPPVPRSLAAAIRAPETVVRAYRSLTQARLDYTSAPGTTMMTRTGEPLRAGDLVEADDGTLCFAATIPWPYGGDPCSDRYGVRVARWQILRAIDVASRYRLAYVYACRPRSSYRGEDVVSLIRAVCAQHGVPRGWRLERGVWESDLVNGVLQSLGSRVERVYSPHAKPYVEGTFSTLWAKLSVQFPDADLGRYRGDTEHAQRLLDACRAGHRDPRMYFPALSSVIAALNQAIAEENATRVNSRLYGSWVPAERWQSQIAEAPLPRLTEVQWLSLTPYVREWTVRGALVGGQVQITDDWSVPVHFGAPWLLALHGARVRVHFDPLAPECRAAVYLAQDFGGRKAGEYAGCAELANDVAACARLAIGWARSSERGCARAARKAASSELRREARAFAPHSRSPAYTESTEAAPSALAAQSQAPADYDTRSPERSGGEAAWNHVRAPSAAHVIAPKEVDPAALDLFDRLTETENLVATMRRRYDETQ